MEIVSILTNASRIAAEKTSIVPIQTVSDVKELPNYVLDSVWQPLNVLALA